MTYGTVHGKVTSTPGGFQSGWFLMNKFTVSATTQIAVTWPEYMPDITSVRVEFRNLQTATIWVPSVGLVQFATDAAATFNIGNCWFKYGGNAVGASVEVFTNSVGAPGAFQWSATGNICGATGGTTFPAGWDFTLEVLKVQGGGSGQPFRFNTEWPASSTAGMNSVRGTGKLMLNTQIFGINFSGTALTLTSGDVEVWGMQSKTPGIPV